MNYNTQEVPLNLWFSGNPGLTLPYIAIQQHNYFIKIDFDSLQYGFGERPYDKAKFDRIYKKHYRKKTFKFFHLWYEKIYEDINSEFVQKQINASYDKLINGE